MKFEADGDQTVDMGLILDCNQSIPGWTKE